MPTDVLITGALHDSAIAAFKNNKSLKTVYLPDCTRQELLRHLNKCQVLVTRSETSVDKQVIDQAANLKIIARAAVGVGNIDIEHATERGILVINCPGKNTNSAAELTMALILSMLRNIPIAYVHLKGGGWDRHRFSGREVKDKKLGIIGVGNVGHRVAKFAHGFDMQVFGYDPYVSQEVFTRNGVIPVRSLEELARKVDILSVHVPLTKETARMINGDVLKLMARGSYFVNAARGEVVVEEDVLAALQSGQLAGVAIDTFQNEPNPLPKLLQHERVWGTPHIGASTEEAQVLIGQTVYDQVCKALAGDVVDYPVNLPGVGIPDSPHMKCYSLLAEKLGSLIGQLIDFNPNTMQISYRGNIAGQETSLMRLSLMKGYAAKVVDDYVSFVNAGSHFTRMGIKVEECQDPGFQSYRSALKIVVTGADGKSLSVGGIVFDDTYLRISLINDFYFEFEPQGSLIMVENEDVPGVIGAVGTFLASKEINIDSFELSRNKRGGKAMAVIRIDGELAPAYLSEMRKIKNILAVNVIKL